MTGRNEEMVLKNLSESSQSSGTPTFFMVMWSDQSLLDYCLCTCVCVCVEGVGEAHLTISSGKQLLMALMCSCRREPGSAWISCTFFSPPLVTNRRRALLSCGSTFDGRRDRVRNPRSESQKLFFKAEMNWHLSYWL